MIDRIREYKLKRLTKKTLKEIFKRKNLIDDFDRFPKVKEINFKEYGFTTEIDLNGICSYEEFEKILNYIKTVFKAYKVKLTIIDGIINLFIQTDKLIPKKYKKVQLDPYKCLIGFNEEGNIIVDMKRTPHLLVCGLSGQGKTECTKTIIKNLQGSADVIILNGFREDFKGYNFRIITEREKIYAFLKELLDNKVVHKKPLYLLIDEMLVLNRNKDISKVITDILAIARHYNIFLIGISQEGTKENIKFKHLFNARCTFRQIEESSYRVILGCSVNDDLNKQEFYLYSDELYKGRTFDN